MTERKKTFLERLTGTVVAEDTGNHRGPVSGGDKDSGQETYLAHDSVEESVTVTEDIQYSAENDEEEEQEAGLAIDMYETDNELIIQSMIAGVAPENLHISITRDVVTITGKRIAPGVPQDNYITEELYWGLFSRTITLPFEIDTDGAEAVEKYGLLIIRLPKIDSNKVQELKVKTI